MESEDGSTERDDARAQLDLITEDRQALAQRVAQHPWWHTLASAAITAVIVAAPLSGSMWIVTLISVLLISASAALDKECDKRMGVSIMKPVGRRSLAIVITLVTVEVALFAASVGIMFAELSGSIAVNSALAAVLMIVGLRMLSHTMAQEIRHGR
ncbi:hypothetical protein ESZ53_08470 [Salinibacterium sp. UTAS2018]|uniref:hypothetical protein n=1 Tax=Salinibacterium sp. UTAS2018 TaxID=2508880 RepID=UPI0010096F28|nr:hypothetical protein [Salinibacterium sp. UTAS2018]QAV70472.1 hypothetical protein ESZ53_08470 [Salinibacterium sp. UTAS2018]